MAFIDRLKNWWLESNPTQRYTTIGGVALFLALLAGVFSFASKPKFDMLYGGLSEADKASVVTAVQEMGVPVDFNTPGAVLVPSDKVNELRMQLTTAGKVPKSAKMGVEDLSKMNLTDTPAVERERLKAIAEGELAKSIETNPGVRSARVHITLGDPSPFGDQQRPPSASVSLVTAGSLSREQAKGIAMLVSHSIDGLDMKNVVVLDEKSVPLYNGTELSGTDALASQKLELEQSLARKEEQRMQSNLDAIFGPGSTRVSVRCEVNLDQNEVRKVENKVKKGTALKTMEEKMGGGKQASGGAGSAANNAVGGTPAARDTENSGDYTSKVEQIQPNTEMIETHSNKAVGTVKSMVVNVAANTAKFPEADAAKADEFVSQVETFMKAEAKSGDQTMQVTVTGVKFDEAVKQSIDAAVSESKSAASRQQIISILPIAALLIIGFMVVKQVGKMKPIAQTTAIVTADGQTINVPLVNGQIPTNYAMVGAGAQMPQSLGAEAHAENLTNQIARYSEEELAQMTEDGVIYRDTGDVLEVEKIKERKSVHLAAIKQMAKDRPEPTAMLIKTWLAEV